jgi:hypothetical protein
VKRNNLYHYKLIDLLFRNAPAWLRLRLLRVLSYTHTQRPMEENLFCTNSELVKAKVTLRPTISRSVHHGVELHLGLMTRY